MSSETDNQKKLAPATAPFARSANWVGAWYAARSQMISANLSGRTLRQIVPLHAGGEQLRLRLSNRYGDAPVTLASISVGQVLQGPVVDPAAERAVRFEGHKTVTLEPGQEIVGDPVALQVEGFGVSGATLIEVFEQLARQARKTYRRVFGTTIIPGGYPPEQVEQR